MALSVIKLGARLGVAGGAVYYTVQQGIWGTADEGTEAMSRLSSAISPQIADNLSGITQKPSQPLSSVAAENWNTGMKTILESVSSIPEITRTYSVKGKAMVTSFMKQD